MPRFDKQKIGKYTSHQSNKFIVNKRRRNFTVGAVFVLASALFSYGFVSLVGLQTFQISKINIVGVEDGIKAGLTSSVLNALSGEYAGFIPKANFLLYSKSAVIDAVKNSSTRIEDVSLSRNGFHELSISILEKKPAALICVKLPDFEENNYGGCYFTDDNGTPYMKAPEYSDAVYNRYFMPDLEMTASSSNVMGTPSMPTDTFVELQSFYESVRKVNFDVLGILVKDKNEYELYFANKVVSQKSSKPTSSPDPDAPDESVPGLNPTVVYFNGLSGFSAQLSNFISFWNYMQNNARAKHEVISFDSIDLRYGSNVFYRLSKQ